MKYLEMIKKWISAPKVFVLWIARKIGIVYTFHSIKQENQTINLRTDGWVIVTDGLTNDALPVTFVSDWLQKEFIKHHPDATDEDLKEVEDESDNK